MTKCTIHGLKGCRRTIHCIRESDGTKTWTAKTADEMIARIDQDSDTGFGPNPVAVVECPHCPARLFATDAKAHVRTYIK